MLLDLTTLADGKANIMISINGLAFTVLAVTGGLLFTVSRSIRRSRDKVARLIGSSGDTNSLQALSTLMGQSGSGAGPTNKEN